MPHNNHSVSYYFLLNTLNDFYFIIIFLLRRYIFMIQALPSYPWKNVLTNVTWEYFVLANFKSPVITERKTNLPLGTQNKRFFFVLPKARKFFNIFPTIATKTFCRNPCTSNLWRALAQCLHWKREVLTVFSLLYTIANNIRNGQNWNIVSGVSCGNQKGLYVKHWIL